MRMKCKAKKREKPGWAYKLFLYFGLTVLLITSLNSIITYVFVQKYNEQVRTEKYAMLEQIGTQMQQRVFQSAQRLYVDLISNTVLYPELKGFFQDTGRGGSRDPLAYYRIYNSLRAAASSTPGTFREVAVYSKAADMVISTTAGANWLNDSWLQAFPLDWTERALQRNGTLFWEYTPEQVSEITGEKTEDAAIVLYGTYPFNVPGDKCRGVVKIRLENTAIKQLFQEYRTRETSYYFLDRQGRAIVSVGGGIAFTELFGSMPDPGNYEHVGTYDINGTETVIITRPWQEDYILVSATSLADFYEQTNHVRDITSVVELGVLLLGFMLAGFFSNRLYRPFSILEQNYPLIRDGFLQTLLNDMKQGENEIKEKLRLLRISFPHPLFCAVRIFVPEKTYKTLTMEQKVVLLYKLLDNYNAYEDSEVRFYGTRNDDRSITLIANLTREAEKKRDLWMKEISDECLEICQFRPDICSSACVQDISRLGGAYRQTAALESYFYYMTGGVYLAVDRIPALNRETAENISPQLLKDFADHLKSFDREGAQADIARLVEECKTGRYAARHCREQLFSAVSALIRFIYSVNLEDSPFYLKIFTGFFRCMDIDSFQEWMCGLIDKYIRIHEQNSVRQYTDILPAIADYIRHHLAEPISLDLLGDTFHLSPNYLSRLFKEVFGVNYTDYLNNVRLESAAGLLSGSAKKIDDIARQTGFNSSVYFIKRFKQKYGVTPKKYRIDTLMRKAGEGAGARSGKC